uniref:Uncharacterized protein n=1 Tax=uncultured marine virus TaxID=186617 RepID=A0A0F7L0I0_9VIRU|nr:hypothetical protein [uncultured marine virus]
MKLEIVILKRDQGIMILIYRSYSIKLNHRSLCRVIIKEDGVLILTLCFAVLSTT